MPVKKKKELNSDKAAEPMYMHNEAATQNLVSSGNRACSEQDWQLVHISYCLFFWRFVCFDGAKIKQK